MNIHCMHCGHSIVLDSTYDDFSGPLRCSVCKGMMMVRIQDGQLRAMEPFPPVAAAPPPAVVARATAAPAQPLTQALAQALAQPLAEPARAAGTPTGMPPERNGSVPPGNPGVNR